MKLFGREFGKKQEAPPASVAAEEDEFGTEVMIDPELSAASKFTDQAGRERKLFLPVAGIVVIAGMAGGYFYLVSAEEEEFPRPVPRMAVVQPPQQAPAAETKPPAAVVSVPEKKENAVVVEAPQAEPPAAALSPVSPETAVAVPEKTAEKPDVPMLLPLPLPQEEVKTAVENISPKEPVEALPKAAENITSPEVPAAPTAVELAIVQNAPKTAETAEAAEGGGIQTLVPIPKEAEKSATAAPPTAAELAILENTAVLHSLNPAVPALLPPVNIAGPASGEVVSDGRGQRVTDILAQPADIRELPKRYLIVQKERDADDTDSRLTAARTALTQGRYGASLELFNELYIKDSKDKRILMGRAVAMQKLGQFSEAMAAYEDALINDPKNLEALTNMLGILKVQNPGAALEKLQQLREVYPYNSDITAQLGMVYGATGDYENAMKYLEMADALKPGNINILYNRAVVYDRMGKARQAADLYRQIVSMAGDGTLEQSFPVDAVKKRLATIH